VDETTLLKDMEVTNASFLTPVTAMSSYVGQLMTIKHYVEIVFTTTGMMTSNPTIKIPVQVGEAVPVLAAAAAATMAATDKVSSLSPSCPATAIPRDIAGTTTTTPISTPTSYKNVVPVNQPDEKTVEGLLRGLEASVQDLAYIQECVKDTEWKDTVLTGLSAAQYGSIVGAVGSEFDQPAVATALAEIIVPFTCAHVMTALSQCAAWSRAAITERLLPYCTDRSTHQELIKTQLTEWEQMVTQAAFDAAVKAT
jgi:hypothetical protein